MTFEIGVLVALGVLALGVLALAWRDARRSDSGIADDVPDGALALAPGPEPVALLAPAVLEPTVAEPEPAVPGPAIDEAATPVSERSPVEIVPEPDQLLTALAASQVGEGPTEEPLKPEDAGAPVEAIQLGPPAEPSASAAPALGWAASRPIVPLRLDLVRLTSHNRRERVVAPAGTHLVTDSGALIRTLVEVVIPSATDAGPGSVDVPIEFVGARPTRFKSGTVVDWGQIDLVTAIISPRPRTGA
jgi:hypothetical protein